MQYIFFEHYQVDCLGHHLRWLGSNNSLENPKQQDEKKGINFSTFFYENRVTLVSGLG